MTSRNNENLNATGTERGVKEKTLDTEKEKIENSVVPDHGVYE
jgi:hypothetical protein